MKAKAETHIRPIILSAAEVQSVQRGEIVELRRLMKPEPGEDWEAAEYGVLQRYRNGSICEPDEKRDRWGVCNEDGDEGFFSPFGGPGDRLWVRENHWRWTGCGDAPSDFLGVRCFDDHPNLHGYQQAAALVRVPSVLMPRWASRITLDVLAVQVTPDPWTWICHARKVD